MPEVSERFILDTFDTALRNSHIRVYYQPVIRTVTREVCGFEALARWIDPELGMIMPDQFIHVLERNHLIHRLDAFVVRDVCAELRQSIDEGASPLPISVNLSWRDFELFDVYAMMDEVTKEFRIPHNYLSIEITERVFSEDELMMHRAIESFHAAGYEVWMDDFGSGYSSLNLLKDYTFDELKVDMRFLSSFHLRSRKILTSIINMSKDIGIRTLCEGVETEDQLRFLQDIGCEKVQGFLFARPMPLRQLLDHLSSAGLATESLRSRDLYEQIGALNYLSSAPFMSARQRDSLKNARQLNSIPLALVELRGERFRILYYNAAFDRVASATHWGREIFKEDVTGVFLSTKLVPDRLLELMRKTRASQTSELYFISNGEYYEFRSKCVADSQEAYCILLKLDNLSRNLDFSRMNTLDAEMRNIYTLMDRVTLLDLKEDRVMPLYVGAHEEAVTSGLTVRGAVIKFTDSTVFWDDRGRFLTFYRAETMEDRILRSGRSYIEDHFRTRNENGQFAWTRFSLVRIREGAVLSVQRSAESDFRALREHIIESPFRQAAASDYPDSLLWQNLIRSAVLCLFWKDDRMRYLGVSRGFLKYFGLETSDGLLGKTDEEIGWHIHTDHVKNTELSTLRDARVVRDMPAKFLAQGVNHDVLYSCSPLYNNYGRTVGLVGFFRDRDPDARQETGQDYARMDGLTKLLNPRGVTEAVFQYVDEYYRREKDFVRIHIEIEDFVSIIRRHGYDHSDRIIQEMGKALRSLCGTDATLGRISGARFVILRRHISQEDTQRLIDDVKDLASQFGEVDGIPCSFYLASGQCLFSECLDTEQQARLADTRVLADHSVSTPTSYRISTAGEIFRMYDDIPLSFAVYKMILDGDGRVSDAEFFYVNHRFSQEQHKQPEEIIGRRMSEIFPNLEAEWYSIAHRAAFLNQQVTMDNIYFAEMKTHYRLTSSQVIRNGFCAFTYQPLDGPFALPRPELPPEKRDA